MTLWHGTRGDSLLKRSIMQSYDGSFAVMLLVWTSYCKTANSTVCYKACSGQKQIIWLFMTKFPVSPKVQYIPGIMHSVCLLLWFGTVGLCSYISWLLCWYLTSVCWHGALQWRHNERPKSPACRLFAQPFVQGQIKENIKAPYYWPL